MNTIKSHLNSLVALDLLPSTIDAVYNSAKAKKIFHLFTPALRASVSGKRDEKAFTIAIIVHAPNFSSKTINGKEISLSFYKGKDVPASFLSDPSGKIIGKNLHGEELEAKLAGVLPKSKSK